MAYPDNLLVQGERVIVRKRPHWKVLVLPTILFVVIIGAAAALATWISKSNWQNPQWAYYAIIAVAVVALIILVLVPFVRWRTEHFVITNHHVFFRTGLLSRREHQIPLGQIANMETEVTFWGRLMGYGSLVVESSADQPLKFRNVASLSKVQAQLNQLIRDERERTHRDGDRGPGGEQQDQQPRGYPQQYVQPQQNYSERGHAQESYAEQGYPQQSGQPQGSEQGYPQQGRPPAGYGEQGYPQQGRPPQGSEHGYPQQGYPDPGYQQQSYPQQGYPQQGFPQVAGSSGYPEPGQAQPGYQPTRAFQQSGYPPPNTDSAGGGHAAQAGTPSAAPSASASPAPGQPPQSGSAHGDGGQPRS